MKGYALLASALVLLAAAPANADCIGSGSFQTCFDQSGNSYTVSRMGNTTIMNGYNAGTGSTWSQNSITTGNTTFHSGMTNGNSWNATDQHLGGGMRSIFGTDSQGRSFNYTCGVFGCN